MWLKLELECGWDKHVIRIRIRVWLELGCVLKGVVRFKIKM